MLHAAMLRHVRYRKWRDKPAATSATIAFPSAKALKLRTVLFSGGMESWFVIERKSHHPLPAFAEGQPPRDSSGKSTGNCALQFRWAELRKSSKKSSKKSLDFY